MKKHIKVGKPRCATTLEETIRKKVQHCPGCDKVYERVALLEEHILTCEKYRGVLRNVRISSSSQEQVQVVPFKEIIRDYNNPNLDELEEIMGSVLDLPVNGSQDPCNFFAKIIDLLYFEQQNMQNHSLLYKSRDQVKVFLGNNFIIKSFDEVIHEIHEIIGDKGLKLLEKYSHTAVGKSNFNKFERVDNIRKSQNSMLQSKKEKRIYQKFILATKSVIQNKQDIVLATIDLIKKGRSKEEILHVYEEIEASINSDSE